MKRKRNIYNKADALKILRAKNEKRKTLSFYRYVYILDAEKMRETLYDQWSDLGVLGRTYIAYEGINAQISVPVANWEAFVEKLYAHPEFDQMMFKHALDEDDESFWKLTIKVKKQIVADGLANDEYDVTNIGTHLTAEEWNKLAVGNDVVMVDMRNQYESEIGYFERAILPDVDTFKEELPLVKNILAEHKDKKVLLYCTGGVRCEKTSAYLKHNGIENVYQLHGGIIQYIHEVKQKGLKSLFKGKNFVFDGRMGERATEDIVSHCHQCDKLSDTHTNCANDACHLLFIQCADCKTKIEGCCSTKCMETIHLPLEEQIKIRKSYVREGDQKMVYKSRLRPHLKLET